MKKTKKSGFNAMGTVGNIVGASVVLGVGANVLGAMGQGSIATKTITPAANMLGPVATAGMGMGILGMMNEMIPKKKKK